MVELAAFALACEVAEEPALPELAKDKVPELPAAAAVEGAETAFEPPHADSVAASSSAGPQQNFMANADIKFFLPTMFSR